MRIFDVFDQIRIINLPERTDRRRDMMRELAGAGLADDSRVFFFDAIRPTSAGDFTSIGARGVFESQKQILFEAARTGSSVLILEDDCTFTSFAPAYETTSAWEIFYGGYYANEAEDLQQSDIIGAHMMGFSTTGATLLTRYLAEFTYSGVHPPIDAAYVWYRRSHPEVRTEFAVPPLAYQRPSRSDIAKLSFYDKLPVLRGAAALLRRAVRDSANKFR